MPSVASASYGACVPTHETGAPRLSVAIVLRLIGAYKLFISPLFAGSCRFLPTCADYSAEAYRRHGIVRGTWLTLRRLGRCHPLCRHGYDPVPDSAPGSTGASE